MSDSRSSTPRDRSAQDVGQRADPAGEPGTQEEWQAPWVATPEHPQGAADLPAPPQSSTGHYGPGYADPTRHFGDTLPGQPSAAPATSAGIDAGEQTADSPSQPAAATAPDAQDAHRDRPDLRSDEVGFRPPDRLPGEDAPESENAALIFERS